MRKAEIEKIKADLMNYILDELELAQDKDSTMEDKLYARNRAYGALLFVNNKVVPYDAELGNWWNNVMRDNFLKKV